MTVKNPVRLLKLMIVGVRVVNAIKKAGGEEGFKFFLNLLELQQTEISMLASLAAPNTVVEPAKEISVSETNQAEAVPHGIAPSAPATLIDRPARVLEGERSAPKLRVVLPPSGDFADKLNGAAKQLGLEDKSPLGQFRKMMKDAVSRGKEYWDGCRALTATVLTEGLLESEADWKLLIEKMKHNLFFTTGKSAEVFIANCPKNILSDLVVGQGGLSGLVQEIRNEMVHNRASEYKISFVLGLCTAVGEDAVVILENCKHAVNRMKQKKFIASDHWLVRKVANMNHPTIPARKYYDPKAEPIQLQQESKSAAM